MKTTPEELVKWKSLVPKLNDDCDDHMEVAQSADMRPEHTVNYRHARNAEEAAFAITDLIADLEEANARVDGFIYTGMSENYWKDRCAIAEAKLTEAEKDVEHWRANHDNVVAKLRLFTQREDLPVDRLPAYEYVLELEKKLAEMTTYAKDQERGAKSLAETVKTLNSKFLIVPETVFEQPPTIFSQQKPLEPEFAKFLSDNLFDLYATGDEQQSELEMHRADYEACKAAGWESPGELLSAYKTLEKKLAEAQELIEPYCKDAACWQFARKNLLWREVGDDHIRWIDTEWQYDEAEL